jgi:putative nucleotidyltransferase with HDIG domain
MMKFTIGVWNKVNKGSIFIDSRLKGEDSSIREYITQVILKLLGGALGLFTAIIFFAWWAGKLDYEAPVIVAIVDLPFVLGLGLVHRRKWQLASYLPPITFFLLALMVNYSGGLYTTAILFYAISILLAGMLQGNKAQFLALGCAILSYGLIVVVQPRAVIDDVLPPLIMVSGSLLGIALLQWLFNSQFHKALAQAYTAASELEQRSTELAKSNQDLKGQISARIEAQSALQEAERVLSTLMGNLPGMAYRCRQDRDWTMEFVSEGCLPLTGYHPAELILNQKISYNQIIHVDDREFVRQAVDAGLKKGMPFELVYRIISPRGEVKWVWEKGRGILSPQGKIVAIEGFITDVSDQIQKEIDLERYAERLKVLHEIDQAVLAAGDPAAIARAGLTEIRKLIPCKRASVTLFNFETNDATIVAVDVEHETQLGEEARIKLDHFSGLSELLLGNWFVVEDLLSLPERSLIEERLCSEGVRSVFKAPILFQGSLIGSLNFGSEVPASFTEEQLGLARELADSLAIAIKNSILLQDSQRQAQMLSKRASELESLTDISLTLRTALTVEEMLPDLLRKTVAAFNACVGSIYLLDQETGDLVAHAWYPTFSRLHGHRLSVGASIAGQIATAGEIHITDNMDEDPWSYLLPYDYGLESTIRTGVSLPLRTNESIVGVMHFGLPESPFAVNERIHLARTIADMVALAIWRANLFEETQRRFEHLLVLRKIDRTITSTMELRPILDVLLDQITAHLHVDAATILLLAPHTQTLDTAARRGFNTPALQHTHLPLGKGYAGRAALERRVIHIGNLAQAGGDLSQADLFLQEGFASYFAFPLVAKGQVKGVLELFLRLPFAPDQEWLDFLDALATQAAIAIDNVGLFESMQSANYQLVKAYEATIEGWSKALELRDQETEGHSQRVTEMTLRLARDMGIGDEELAHIRRGALLHDIGKMAIPDHILQKPGPLTEDEWVIMRRHPVHAYELLTPIAYLRPALDIPYCHHEKWDGSGYPRGLKGEQIPLSARIFAVVDVWDALSSDRPYRKAWEDQKIVDYIGKEMGKHFDSEVVNVFFSYFDQSRPVIRLDLESPRLFIRPKP